MAEVHKVVPLSKIHPDENQPRKDFNAHRLAELKSSIKTHGIISPLVVEGLKSGEYLLVDGERRFRAAKELKLKEVPVIVMNPTSETERIVRQFHLQEQHQGWTPVEKAVAVGFLAESLSLNVSELAKMLSLSSRTIADYEAFYSLMERTNFQKSELPLHFAKYMGRVVRTAKSVTEKVLEEEFTTDMQRSLEQQLISSVKSGDITKPSDFSKLADSFRAEPDTLKKFLKGKMTVSKLYLESNAKVAFHARNVRQLSALLNGHIKQTMELGGVELLKHDVDGVGAVKRLQKNVENLLSVIE